MILVQEKIKIVKGSEHILHTRPDFRSFFLSSLPAKWNSRKNKKEDEQLKSHLLKKCNSSLGGKKIQKNRNSGKFNENLKKGQIKPLKFQRASC